MSSLDAGELGGGYFRGGGWSNPTRPVAMSASKKLSGSIGAPNSRSQQRQLADVGERVGDRALKKARRRCAQFGRGREERIEALEGREESPDLERPLPISLSRIVAIGSPDATDSDQSRRSHMWASTCTGVRTAAPGSADGPDENVANPSGASRSVLAAR